ncbi:MAG: MCE family protein, partial [Candidatus Cloacimonetes bacterium]|nr:MCE family protein [Candidatus Cloacimonadota bacterium]
VLGAEKQEIRARFRNVGSVMKGNDVKLRGVPIGRVESVELEPDGQAVLITMSIAEGVRLPEDPVVLLSAESFFGDWQAQILPRATYPQYDYLESPTADVLPGYSLPDMSQLTAVGDEIAQNLRTLSDRFEIAFTEETALNIRRVVENVQIASEQLNSMMASQKTAIEDVATNLRQTSETLGVAAATVQRTFQEVERAIGSGRLETIIGNVEGTTANTDSLTAELLRMSGEFERVAARLDTTLATVNALASDMQQGRGTLGLLMQDSTLYLSLVEANAELQSLLEDLQRNPRKYINLRVF